MVRSPSPLSYLEQARPRFAALALLSKDRPLALRSAALDPPLHQHRFSLIMHQQAAQETHRETRTCVPRTAPCVVLSHASLWIERDPGVERTVRTL